MKQFISFLLILVFTACGSNSKETEANTALDAGRSFIRASLDGDFDKAEELLLRDSMNVQLYNSYKEYYKKQPEDVKKNYKNSDYTINEIKEEADSVTIINYSNSYMNKPMEIKVVSADGKWNIDFKHTSGN